MSLKYLFKPSFKETFLFNSKACTSIFLSGVLLLHFSVTGERFSFFLLIGGQDYY
jgi:hypothetical protein